MKFRKKPIVVEAIQFTGHNDQECLVFCPTARDPPEYTTMKPSWLKSRFHRTGHVVYSGLIDRKPTLMIPTLEGEHLCSVGDWIIKGVKGEFYPCRNDIFLETYERVLD
jgi:hypothetical protein